MTPLPPSALSSDLAPSGSPVFATTRWSLVAAAREGALGTAREAMEALCRAYWFPIYAHLRRKGHNPTEAQDLTQGFFAHLLARDFLQGVSREHGRFRAFLLASLRNFLADQRDRATALKRGGGRPPLSIDEVSAEERYRLEPVDRLSADLVFERRWALALLEMSLDRLREEFAAGGRGELFEVLRRFQGDDPTAETGAAAALRLGIPLNTFKSHLRRFRRRYRELLCEEVARTVATPAEIEVELRHLKAVLSQG